MPNGDGENRGFGVKTGGEEADQESTRNIVNADGGLGVCVQRREKGEELCLESCRG
jgi:hypothetical protein